MAKRSRRLTRELRKKDVGSDHEAARKYVPRTLPHGVDKVKMICVMAKKVKERATARAHHGGGI